ASEYVRRDTPPLPASARAPLDVAIAVAPGRALPLREAAHDSCPPVAAESPPVPDGWDVLGLRVADETAFAERLLDFSPSVVALEPASLVRAHVELLTRTARSLVRLVAAAGGRRSGGGG